MKSCSKCKEVLPRLSFYKDKRTKDGLYSDCKKCHQSKSGKSGVRPVPSIRTEPTVQNVTRHMFGSIRYRVYHTVAYQHVKLLMTESEYESFIEQNWDEYMRLYKVWEENGFKRKFAPSTDRIDSKGHYEIGNIRLLTCSENCRLAWLGKTQSPEHFRKRMLSQNRTIAIRKLKQTT